MSYDMISSFIIIQIYALKIFSTVTHGFGPGPFPARLLVGKEDAVVGSVSYVRELSKSVTVWLDYPTRLCLTRYLSNLPLLCIVQ